MVVLLAALVLGGLAWLISRKRGATTAARIDGAPPRPPERPFGGQPVPAGQLPDGRIVVSGLTKEYRGVKAVDDLSFVVEPGRVTGFLGPNGAGKTTTLRMLSAWSSRRREQPPSAAAATSTWISRSAGSAASWKPARPTRAVPDAIICVSSACRPASRWHGRMRSWSLVGLTVAGGRTFGAYSLGMRQRLGLAAALLGDPQVLILDEPANGLDPEGIRWMRDLLRTLAAHGRTVLLSSHLLAEMKLLADDLIIIAAGRLAARGTVASIVSSMTHGGRILVRTPEPGKLAAVLGSDAVVTPAGDGDVYITGVDAVAIGDAAQRAGIAIHQLVTERPDLEAAFLELTAGKAAIR